MAENSETFRAFRERWLAAVDAGLVAAADAYVPAVKARLAHGYTSGAWLGQHKGANAGKATVTVVDSVHRTGPRGPKTGNRAIRVLSDVYYAAFWEFGHHNVFTKRYERVQHWRTALGDSLVSMANAFSAAFSSTLGAS